MLIKWDNRLNHARIDTLDKGNYLVVVGMQAIRNMLNIRNKYIYSVVL